MSEKKGKCEIKCKKLNIIIIFIPIVISIEVPNYKDIIKSNSKKLNFDNIYSS